ncbi:hypothetical protein AYL99_08950 [Fonsecaea erecta]|uniref:Mid2 domain-containing protein n=1 Tax=Fonsecaea erecta TaxID=1367422 RepID=A0A178ZAN4_9EURO|nr:hypothetical protein AYL99_08950 [Fonsecaea erecta]OAP56838.1 hypothetical protein AYL99_08950 [Fonsecaea erecta]
MSLYCYLSVITWALSLIATSASPASDVTFSSYNDAGLTEVETLRILRRALSSSGSEETVSLFDETLDKSWDEAVLFAITMDADADVSTGTGINGSVETQYGVQIVCSTCYIAGRVSGQLTRNADFNITELEDGALDLVKNITEEAGQALADLADGNANYTEIDFNVALPSFPDFDYRLQFRFDDLELYMQLDTVLSVESTYTINLYTSKTPAGVSLGDHLAIGAFFTVDLILTAAAEVDISSGLHLKVDGVGINLQMFNQSVDSITLDGGMFEFLPVHVEGAGFVLTGALRVGLHAGITFDIDSSLTIANHTLGASAGLEAGVFANIAEFVANVTYDDSGRDGDCELALVESFTMALGAAAGASAAFDQTTWGPTPETEVPIWYTELGSACAAHRSSSATSSSSSALITARDATSGAVSLTLATVTTETTSSGVACISPGLINCPVSLQTTKTFTATLTSTTSVPFGSAATWPATTSPTPVRTVAFGSKAKALSATTGSPVSYVPPPPPSSTTSSATSSGTAQESHGSHEENHKALIIGLSVGLGVPALAVIVGLTLCLLRGWKRYTPMRKDEGESHGLGVVTEEGEEEIQPASRHERQGMLKGMTTVEVDEAD